MNFNGRRKLSLTEIFIGRKKRIDVVYKENQTQIKNRTQIVMYITRKKFLIN
jgi:hypothetical protein